MCSSQASLCSRWQRLVLPGVPSSGKTLHRTHIFLCFCLKLKDTAPSSRVPLHTALATHTELDTKCRSPQPSDPSGRSHWAFSSARAPNRATHQIQVIKNQRGFVHLTQDKQHFIVYEFLEFFQVAIHVFFQLIPDLQSRKQRMPPRIISVH